MPVPNIVRGQKIKASTLQRAKEMRSAMTPAERKLWNALRHNRLRGLHFRRQQIIGGFIVDFYCHAAALVVEVDGPIHETRAERDAERDRILTARGLRVLRFKNEQVMKDLEGVLEAISAAVALSPRPPSLPENGGEKDSVQASTPTSSGQASGTAPQSADPSH